MGRGIYASQGVDVDLGSFVHAKHGKYYVSYNCEAKRTMKEAYEQIRLGDKRMRSELSKRVARNGRIFHGWLATPSER